MRKFIVSILILILIFLTTFIKNSSKDLDVKIYKSEASISSLNDKYELLQLEFNYLTSPDKLEDYKKIYFNNFFVNTDLNSIGEIIINENNIVIKENKEMFINEKK